MLEVAPWVIESEPGLDERHSRAATSSGALRAVRTVTVRPVRGGHATPHQVQQNRGPGVRPRHGSGLGGRRRGRLGIDVNYSAGIDGDVDGPGVAHPVSRTYPSGPPHSDPATAGWQPVGCRGCARLAVSPVTGSE